MMKHPIAATLSFSLGLALLATAAGSAAAGSAASGELAGFSAWTQESAAQDGEPLYFASVKTDGVVVRNLTDAKGLPVAELNTADVVAVYAEGSAGWLEVEIPTGYAAYVFGRFLEPTESAGIYRVTRNAVNIRPNPSDDVLSFPLPQRLHAGDQVEVIGQDDPTKPMAEDWVRIWTPPGVRAFLRAEHVSGLNVDAGKGAWVKASAEIAAARTAVISGRTPADEPGANADSGASAQPVEDDTDSAEEASATGLSISEARESLRQLRGRVEAEQAKTTPDFGTLQSELSALIDAASDPSVKAEIARELDRVTALAEAAAMFQELQRIKDQKDQETARIQKSIWEEGRRLDPLRSAFDVHGVLVRRIAGDGTPRYTIEVRREVVAELLCTTGRYDLDSFSGYEIGVKGRSVVAEAAATKDKELDVPVLDIARIAVLKRR